MSYLSIDELQKAFAENIFGDRQDTKKAAGRALGTLVELITYYLLREWGLGPTMTIELSIPEFANHEITHNVEFAMHPIVRQELTTAEISHPPKSITVHKILKALGESSEGKKTSTLISAKNIQRNACVLKEMAKGFLVANLLSEQDDQYQIEVVELMKEPFAMAECKRVGVEEGAKKGPTSIEKAKQGAYVAKHVSSLQKIRAFDGQLFGARAKPDGTIELRPWEEELRRSVYECSADELKGFVMTIGIVSNHGNWFTSDDPNKELRVLKQSYDWLLFLNDMGIAEFVEQTLMSNSVEMAPVRTAFHESYAADSKGNQFTKVKISYEAHKALSSYFKNNLQHIENTWFSVLSPPGELVQTLHKELKILRDKDW